MMQTLEDFSSSVYSMVGDGRSTIGPVAMINSSIFDKSTPNPIMILIFLDNVLHAEQWKAPII